LNANVLLVRQRRAAFAFVNHDRFNNGFCDTVLGTKIGDDAYRAWRGGKRRSSMDIIASMLAYLGCVTGILGALAISFFVVFSSPDQPTMPISTVAMTAKPSVAKAATVAAVTAKPPAPKIAQVDSHPTSLGPKREIVPQAATGRTASAINVRQKTQLWAAQVRRQEQEQRARRWAYQQNPDFEARFLGYAD
jgi:hypothetical protein